VNSTVDLETVLNTIVAKATQLSSTEAGAIYVFDQTVQRIPPACNLRNGRCDHQRNQDRHIRIGDTVVGEAGTTTHPDPDSGHSERSQSSRFDVIVRAGFPPPCLIVPLLGADRTVGALVVRSKQPV